jgi:hypothetical protein
MLRRPTTLAGARWHRRYLRLNITIVRHAYSEGCDHRRLGSGASMFITITHITPLQARRVGDSPNLGPVPSPTRCPFSSTPIAHATETRPILCLPQRAMQCQKKLPWTSSMNSFHRWGPFEFSSLATPEDEGDRTPTHVYNLVSSGPNSKVVVHDNETLGSDAAGPVHIILVDGAHSGVIRHTIPDTTPTL